MDINKLAEDLLSVVDPEAFISEDNLEKLSSLRASDIHQIRMELDGEGDIGRLDMYKIAFLHGRNRFRKEAELTRIRQGVEAYGSLKKKVV